MKTYIYPVGLIICIAMATAAQRHPRLPESEQVTSQPDPFDMAFESLDGYMAHDMAYEDWSGVPRTHLQKAVQIDPEFADARNDLSVALAKLGRLQESADELRKAVEILPGHNQAAANVSLVLLRLKQYQEAGQMARLALKMNPGNLQLCYVLGVALFVENADNSEALYNLGRAAVQFPRARLIISDILIDTGQPSEAVKELEEYLRGAPEADPARSQIEARLAQLRY